MVDISAYTDHVSEPSWPSGPIDYPRIAADLSSRSREVLGGWFPNGKVAGKDFVVGNLFGDKGDSLKISLKTGQWFDFATGECGTDMISLYAQMHGMSNHDAALELAGPNPPTRDPVAAAVAAVVKVDTPLERGWVEAPAWQEKPICKHYKYGVPSMTWIYRNENGKVIGVVARYDPAGERKQFVPWTWNIEANTWQMKGWQGLRPLYRLDELAKEDPPNVLIVEGEKAAEAARKIVGRDWFPTTWPGGAKAVGKVDLNALNGRAVLLWPDADEAGVSAMLDLAQRLQGIAGHVAVLDVTKFPAKWDAADALADGWDSERFDKMLQDQFGEEKEQGEAEDPAEEVAPIPPHIMTIPGKLQLGVEWFMANSTKPQITYAVQTMLGLGSVCLGRCWKTNYSNWSPLYLGIIGQTGSGKEYIKKAIEEVLDKAGMPQLMGPSSYSSASGLISTLLDKPNHLQVTDEWGKTLEAMNDKNNTLKRETNRLMIELWGRCDGTQLATGMSTTGMSRRQIEEMNNRFVVKPSLVQIAMTAPDVLYDNLSTSMISDGFLNRYLVVQCDSGRMTSKFKAKQAPPQELADWCAAQRPQSVPGSNIAGVEADHTMEPVAREMVFSKAACDLISEFDQRCVDEANAKDVYGLGELWNRANEIAMRLSMIIARSCDSITIERDHLKWAQDYVWYWTSRFVVTVRDHVSDSQFGAALQDAKKIIKRSGPAGISESNVINRSRRIQKLPTARARQDVFDTLRRHGLVDAIVVARLSNRGPKTVRYVWVGADDDET